MESIAVTGGNGRIGEAIIEHLNDHGYRTVDVARGKRREEVSDEYRTTDLLDPGEVYGSLAAADVDAVIHMGTIPAPGSHPEHVTYRSNSRSAYLVLEAAAALGLESVVLPSSVNVMGSVYQAAPMEVEYLPVDEAHPVTPRDPYALGKQAAEQLGDGFARRTDTDLTISSLRYPWVMHDDEIEEHLAEADRSMDALADANPHTTRDVLFSYLHIEDGADIARRAAEADFEGHERFWAVAADTTAAVPSADLAAEFYPNAETVGDLEGHGSLASIEKARDLLGWEPTHSWRSV